MRQLGHSREDDMRVETKKGVVFEAGMWGSFLYLPSGFDAFKSSIPGRHR